jgi:sterol desaturase/sphingolipid hydroxylase (fatty acid hydroxylase superfamily)
MWQSAASGIDARPVVVLGMVALIALEASWRTLVQRRNYDAKAAAASIGVAVGHAATGVLNGAFVSTVYLALWDLTPIHLPVKDWRTWIVGFIAVEFAYYWFHRWSHAVRWLWASHAVHHSAEEFTLPAAVRLGWTSALSGGWLVFAPLVLLGWHPVMVAGLLALNLMYQFLLHTEAVGKLGFAELVLNTPAHHRVHHASNANYIDKNFGGVLIVFDRWFGTYADELPHEPCRYGLTKPLRSYNPLRLALQEWGDLIHDAWCAPSASAALRVLFGPPAAADIPAK